jgi:hypothetical protein
LQCQNILIAVIGAKGFLDALSSRHTLKNSKAGGRHLPRHTAAALTLQGCGPSISARR